MPIVTMAESAANWRKCATRTLTWIACIHSHTLNQHNYNQVVRSYYFSVHAGSIIHRTPTWTTRIFNVRMWLFLCVHIYIHTAEGGGHTDSESAHFWLGKTRKLFLCSWWDSNLHPLDLGTTLYQLSHSASPYLHLVALMTFAVDWALNNNYLSIHLSDVDTSAVRAGLWQGRDDQRWRAGRPGLRVGEGPWASAQHLHHPPGLFRLLATHPSHPRPFGLLSYGVACCQLCCFFLLI